jgi:hypothetical protein
VSQSLGIEHDADLQFVRSRPRNEFPTARRSSVLSRQEALRGDVGKGKRPGECPTITSFLGLRQCPGEYSTVLGFFSGRSLR